MRRRDKEEKAVKKQVEVEIEPAEKDFSIDEKISLLSVYWSEFTHRDSILWSQGFKFYFAALIIMLLPNISKMFEIDISAVPRLAFRILGAILSIAFLYVILGYAKRLEAISKTYNEMLKTLPEQYRRISIRDRRIRFGRFFQGSLAVILSVLLFFSLISVAILLIIFKM